MRAHFILLLTLVFIAFAAPAQASQEHDRARDAVRAGEILPLQTVLSRVTGQFGGRVIDVDLKGGRGGRAWIYRIKMLTPDGRVREVIADAATGQVRSVREGQ